MCQHACLELPGPTADGTGQRRRERGVPDEIALLDPASIYRAEPRTAECPPGSNEPIVRWRLLSPSRSEVPPEIVHLCWTDWSAELLSERVFVRLHRIGQVMRNQSPHGPCRSEEHTSELQSRLHL